MDPFERLHPGLQYHLANTLRWNGLRPTQAAAVEPILTGGDTLVLAPTAGGKTEAAIFPLLSRMASEDWQGVSILYVCPLRALLNNLHPASTGTASGWDAPPPSGTATSHKATGNASSPTDLTSC